YGRVSLEAIFSEGLLWTHSALHHPPSHPSPARGEGAKRVDCHGAHPHRYFTACSWFSVPFWCSCSICMMVAAVSSMERRVTSITGQPWSLHRRRAIATSSRTTERST